jgi:hypothetical protein
MLSYLRVTVPSIHLKRPDMPQDELLRVGNVSGPDASGCDASDSSSSLGPSSGVAPLAPGAAIPDLSLALPPVPSSLPPPLSLASLISTSHRQQERSCSSHRSSLVRGGGERTPHVIGLLRIYPPVTVIVAAHKHSRTRPLHGVVPRVWLPHSSKVTSIQ